VLNRNAVVFLLVLEPLVFISKRECPLGCISLYRNHLDWSSFVRSKMV